MKCKLILEDGREIYGAEILRDGCGGVGVRAEDGSEMWFKEKRVKETYESKEAIDEKWDKLNSAFAAGANGL